MLKPNRHRSKTEWLSRMKIAYYVLYVLIILLFGAIWYMNYDSLTQNGEPFKLFDPNETIGMIFQYSAILFTLAVIPGALYGFKRACAKIAKIEDENLRYDTYYTYATLRMGCIAMAAAMSLIAYMLLGAYKPMLWLAAIGAVALVFTKPGEAKTEQELTPTDDKDTY